MATGSIAETIETILNEGPWIDRRAAQAPYDGHRDRARSIDERPETEGYLYDESDGWYVPAGGRLARFAGGLDLTEIADRWFDDLRDVVLDAYWADDRSIFEPLERASLDLVVVNGRLTRGELYRALVEVQERDSGFRHTFGKTLSHNAHEAIGVPYYAQLIRIWN